MAVRLAVLILALACVSCALLSLRQARVQTAHELAIAQQRTLAVQEEVDRVHAEIRATLAPARIERWMREHASESGDGSAQHGAYDAVVLWDLDPGLEPGLDSELEPRSAPDQDTESLERPAPVSHDDD